MSQQNKKGAYEGNEDCGHADGLLTSLSEVVQVCSHEEENQYLGHILQKIQELSLYPLDLYTSVNNFKVPNNGH